MFNFRHGGRHGDLKSHAATDKSSETALMSTLAKLGMTRAPEGFPYGHGHWRASLIQLLSTLLLGTLVGTSSSVEGNSGGVVGVGGGNKGLRPWEGGKCGVLCCDSYFVFFMCCICTHNFFVNTRSIVRTG